MNVPLERMSSYIPVYSKVVNTNLDSHQICSPEPYPLQIGIVNFLILANLVGVNGISQ